MVCVLLSSHFFEHTAMTVRGGTVTGLLLRMRSGKAIEGINQFAGKPPGGSLLRLPQFAHT